MTKVYKTTQNRSAKLCYHTCATERGRLVTLRDKRDKEDSGYSRIWLFNSYMCSLMQASLANDTVRTPQKLSIVRILRGVNEQYLLFQRALPRRGAW